MSLYLVERDISSVSHERLRLEQGKLASACGELRMGGRRIRYIRSVVVPADGRSLDLFGAETTEAIKEAHDVARLAYTRILEILDFTPSFVHSATSRPRRSLARALDRPAQHHKKGLKHAMNPAPEIARWLADGQRLFGICLETLESAEQLQARVRTMETENQMFRDEIARLRQQVDLLQTDRAEMVAAFNDLAGHVTEVVDHVLRKSENGENAQDPKM
jgi:hypothetical protein